ncbi:hypothetical protein GCM10010124_15820 [Pilimelia terevasa]|uniref:SCO6045-like C-terminal domain-containing protein n=1 Tax=Pilimelia terevasa TaxID=53372 RepID=A0A8J3FH00_9ACTN|nr:hypothetical protein [Pilimelia terevasa]GGK24137.1 hypothetical protein GCM10010124_15820 [Pilimelia terevasa]
MSGTAPGLGARQAALVAGLTGTGPAPAGFDAARFAAARAALLAKRADVVAGVWPELARDCGPRWRELFAAWAPGRPPGGGYADGWAFARQRLAAGALGPAAAVELAAAGARLGRPGRRPPAPPDRAGHPLAGTWRRVGRRLRGACGYGRAGRAVALRLGRRLWVVRRP